MLDLGLFKSRVFSFASLSALINFMSLYALIFLTPFYLAYVLGFSILKVGLVMAAAPVATLLVAPLSGALSDRVGTRPFAVCGMFLCAVGLFMMSGLETTSNVSDIVWRLVICGVGGGMFQSPNNSAIMGSVPAMRLGVASGMISTMRTVGMVLGIAVVGAVLYNLAPVAASGNPGQLAGPDIEEFMGGLRWAYISGAVIAAIAAVTSFLAVERHSDS